MNENTDDITEENADKKPLPRFLSSALSYLNDVNTSQSSNQDGHPEKVDQITPDQPTDDNT